MLLSHPDRFNPRTPRGPSSHLLCHQRMVCGNTDRERERVTCNLVAESPVAQYLNLNATIVNVSPASSLPCSKFLMLCSTCLSFFPDSHSTDGSDSESCEYVIPPDAQADYVEDDPAINRQMTHALTHQYSTKNEVRLLWACDKFSHACSWQWYTHWS